MPQLDLFSYFSAATTLVVLFLSLIFILHTYFLPKIAETLKFRNKMANKAKTLVSVNKSNTGTVSAEKPFLDLANTYINEMEHIAKKIKS
jgi:hypothetical protein